MLACSTTRRFASRRMLASVQTAFSRRAMSSDPQAPSSFSHDKMEVDKRYQGISAVPESLLSSSEENSPYSIRGQFREGRAAYLDMSSTTPLDPRVLDAMAPFMVSDKPGFRRVSLNVFTFVLTHVSQIDWILRKPTQSNTFFWLGGGIGC